jgi:hypothetical protein
MYYSVLVLFIELMVRGEWGLWGGGERHVMVMDRVYQNGVAVVCMHLIKMFVMFKCTTDVAFIHAVKVFALPGYFYNLHCIIYCSVCMSCG